ncbi:52 kDa repressor of the inhibitor of the protein kinase-like [Mercenaria mercenaria]|uniref:52 kDa repressor of the inhibitor of the protein kinase-like n=1 Tax=Mercenaria mercenaria TaxID=6596 RepID=UPI00234F289C|nr:52 kDa repressor of the inhibitor of the protein kinase-like [Mercenaria mercenaria]
MSSDRCCVQKHVMEVANKAPYTRCNCHALNLVIVHACKDTDVRFTLDKVKAICIFLKSSVRREGLLIHIVQQSAPSNEKRKPLIDLCKTRWAERHVAFSHFYDSYVFLVESLEYIANGINKSQHDLQLYDGWDGHSRSEAASFLRSITNFDFTVIFMILYQGLFALSGISIQLQEKVDTIKETYNTLRQKINQRFHDWFLQAKHMAERVGTTPELPRTAGRQKNRPNAFGNKECDCETETLCPHVVESYYRNNHAIPFIDHILAVLDLQFSDLSKKCSELLCLVLAVAVQRNLTYCGGLLHTYHDDIPSPGLLQEEYYRWVAHFESHGDNIPDTCVSALQHCDRALYPNIYVLLRLACTLPVSSVECERSASCLQRLYHYTRTAMLDERLSSLAMIHIHYSFRRDISAIIDRFANLHPRKLELKSLIY